MVDHGMPLNLTEVMQGPITDELNRQRLAASISRKKGEECSNRGDHATAIRHYEQAVQAEPSILERARVYEIIGRLQLTLGQPELAEEALRQAEFFIKILPGGLAWDWHPSSVAFVFACDHEDAAPDAAEAAYQVVMRMENSRFVSRAAYNLGLMQLRLHRVNEAMRLFERAFAIGNRNDKGYAASGLAICWEAANNRRRASKYYWIAFHTRGWRSPTGWRNLMRAAQRFVFSRRR